MNPALSYLYHRFLNGNKRWYPLLGVHYLGYQCSFRCPYCSNGFNQPYHELATPPVSAEHTLAILARMQRFCSYLLLTGGEPLEFPHAEAVFAELNKFKFRQLALNTNAFHLAKFLPQIAQTIDTLIVSLDTLDHHKADIWSGQGTGTLQSILDNLDSAVRWPKRKFHLMVSAVATPNNLADLYAVYEYCQSRQIEFAVCPQLQGVSPVTKLRHSQDYRDLFDFLIREKKQGRAIFGSPLYLRHMRDFTPFRCHPFTLLVTDPAGEIFYPCLELGYKAGNILQVDDLHLLRRQSQQRFGPSLACRDCCQSACALGFSVALEYPWQELAHTLHFAWKSRHKAWSRLIQ